eukprot:scaffold429600_cov42-Prasinocladus_malaysianus.AAC.1
MRLNEAAYVECMKSVAPPPLKADLAGVKVIVPTTRPTCVVDRKRRQMQTLPGVQYSVRGTDEGHVEVNR